MAQGLVVVDHRVETFAGADGAGVAVLIDVLQGVDVLQGLDGQVPGGAGLGVSAFSVPGHGSLTLLAAPVAPQGVFRYVPQAGFTGLDYFYYRLESGSGEGQVSGWVEVRVWAVNQPPVAKADLVLVEGDGPVTFQVFDNDRDPDGDLLRITGYTMPALGQLALNADQSFTYWPGPGFFASDSLGGHDCFTYSVRDVRAAGDGQVGVAEAQVTLLRPIVVPAANVPPTAMRDAVVTPRDTAVSIAILGNDTDADGDSLRVAGLTVPLHGSVVLEADQTVTYTPAPGFSGIDDFTYVIDDGRGGRNSAAVVIDVQP